MEFFRKTLFRKMVLSLFILNLLFIVLFFSAYFIVTRDWQSFLSTIFADSGFDFFAVVDFYTPAKPFLLLLLLLNVFYVYFYYLQIVKPLNSVVKEMRALMAGSEYKKVFTTRIDEIGVLAYFFNKMIKGIGRLTFDLKDRERMLDELTIASQLQRDILPTKNPKLPGLSVVAKNRPASEVGGDSFNILTVRDKTYIYIGDVTGHGVAAGLIMTMVNSLISVFAEQSSSAYEIVVNVNKHIKKHVKKAMFMTMVMLCFDHTTKKLTYVGAGHEHILVYRKATGQCDAILSGGVALGMVPDNSALVKEKEISVSDGDFVILYTDGITEARNINDELYELKRLKKAVQTFAPDYHAEGLNFKLAKDVSSFMAGHRQMDDMTLIVLECGENLDEINEKGNNTTW